MHMKEDNIDKLFKRLEGEFDIETPDRGHQQRFLELLDSDSKTVDTTKPKSFGWWKPLAIAASMALLLSLYIGNFGGDNQMQLADVSPEMEQTQFHFTSMIEAELEKVKAVENEDTKVIIQDAMKQMKRLEDEYEKLKTTLIDNGDDKRIIHAMINNFQNRITLLQNVLIQVDEIKLLKSNQDENNVI